MASVERASKIKLDWSKLLGFDQAPAGEAQSKPGRRAVSALAKIGAKAGAKAGIRSNRSL